MKGEGGRARGRFFRLKLGLSALGLLVFLIALGPFVEHVTPGARDGGAGIGDGIGGTLRGIGDAANGIGSVFTEIGEDLKPDPAQP